jgi:hypothetical protein
MHRIKVFSFVMRSPLIILGILKIIPYMELSPSIWRPFWPGSGNGIARFRILLNGNCGHEKYGNLGNLGKSGHPPFGDEEDWRRNQRNQGKSGGKSEEIRWNSGKSGHPYFG